MGGGWHELGEAACSELHFGWRRDHRQTLVVWKAGQRASRGQAFDLPVVSLLLKARVVAMLVSSAVTSTASLRWWLVCLLNTVRPQGWEASAQCYFGAGQRGGDGDGTNRVCSRCRRRRQPAEGLGHPAQSRGSGLQQQEVSEPCPTAIARERQRHGVRGPVSAPQEMEALLAFFIGTISGRNFLLRVL